jgi:phospholipid/cholesterol/gamma-HCH transport system permease protein
MLRVTLEGAWLLASLPVAEPGLSQLISQALIRGMTVQGLPALRVQIDGQALLALDTAGALAVLRLIGQSVQVVELTLVGLQEHHARVLMLVQQRLPQLEETIPEHALGWRARLGASAIGLWQMLKGHLAFFGRVAEAAWRTAREPRTLRTRELVTQLGNTGVTAIPVVALVTFLIGVVFAYLLGLQAEQYGANIFVVDGVALGMTREFSPLIVATIMAGRSGAAFTAQLGTMRLTEETDAIRTLGLSVEQVLVLPRVLGLMLTLPLLVFIGDLAGLSGALVIATTMLDLTPLGFVERLHSALDPRHYLIGLGKAPFFALFIAVIGCRMGIDVARDTRSIGIHTTSTVVQAIVAVIILDAIFAIVCQKLGW